MISLSMCWVVKPQKVFTVSCVLCLCFSTKIPNFFYFYIFVIKCVFKHFPPFPFHIHTKNKIGCDTGAESYDIYEHCEARHARLVRAVWKCGFIFLIIIFGASMSFPIGYALFGYPPPNLWYLPIPSK